MFSPLFCRASVFLDALFYSYALSFVLDIQISTRLFFERLVAQQAPRYLWIGCSDSRVPANVITGLDPGEVFVHRNVANQIDGNDPNIMAVLHFAIKFLKVQDIIVCGHYGCGGVLASQNLPTGDTVLDHWLTPLAGIVARQANNDPNRLCEANVRHQVDILTQLPVIQQAWAGGQKLALHGLVYAISDGILHDLAVTRTESSPRSLTDFAMTTDSVDEDDLHPLDCPCGKHY